MQDANCFFLRLSTGALLGDPERQALRRLETRRIAVPAGHELIAEGEASHHGVVFEQGWGCRYALLEDGRRQILQLLVPGDHAGESGAFVRRADYSIATLTPARVVLFPPAALSELAARLPRLRAALEWSRYRYSAIVQARLIDIGRRSAYERTAHLILELLYRLRLVGEAGEDFFTLPLTQETLADALGLTMVHMNRTLRQLREDGLVDLAHGRLTILDHRRLVELCGFNGAYLHQEPMPRASISGSEAPEKPGQAASGSADRAV